MDRELPELALKAAYNKVQAHSWKELPGQREGAGPQPKVRAACASGGRGGESGRRGKERGTFPASPVSPSTPWWLLSSSPDQV